MDAHDILTTSYLFRDLDTELLDIFARATVVKRHAKGSLLFLHQDEATQFYVVGSGWVKLFRETLDGKEAIVDVVNAGHLLGETAIFEQNHYTSSAEIVEDAVLASLPLSLLQEKIEADPKLAMKLFTAMSRFRRQQEDELEHRDLQTAPQRIGCFLLRLCDPNHNGPVRLNLPYDKMLIASRLGMKPETFSRALNRLKEETQIHIDGATIEMSSIQQLSHYSCSACSSSYPCQDLG